MAQRQPHKRRSRLRQFVQVMFILCFCGGLGTSLALRAVNNLAIQQFVTRWISEWSHWDVSLGKLSWELWQSRITIERLSLINQRSENAFATERIAIQYRPLSLLRWRLRIHDLQVAPVTIQLYDLRTPRQRRAPITLKKLLVLRHLAIDHGYIAGLHATLPDERQVSFEQVDLSFVPGWFRDVRLSLQITRPEIRKGEAMEVQAESLIVAGDTDLQTWVDVAPFINDIRGALTITRGTWRDTTADRIEALVDLRDGRIGLRELQSHIGERTFRGEGYFDVRSEQSALHLAWAEPMPLPELLRPTSFLRTAGTIQGQVDWQGTSFDPSTLDGTLAVDLTHLSDAITDVPAQVQFTGQWTAGVLEVHEGSLRIGDGTARFTSTVDVPKKSATIDFSGDAIPLIGVLGRFRNPDFHPVGGKAKCHGTFRGWARDYTLELEAETEGGGSYYDIALDAVRMQMRLTYPQLTLQGHVLQAGRETGQLDLNVQYGAQREDHTRDARLHLTAQVHGHQLAPSFTAYGLTGTGAGQVSFDGPTTNYTGHGTITITEGSFQDVPLQQAQSTLAFRPAEIRFQPSEIDIPNVPTIEFAQPLVMKIDHGFRLQGQPAPGFSVDMSYGSETHQYTFHSIRYDVPDLGGPPLVLEGQGRAGAWQLHLHGTADAAWGTYFPDTWREAEGPLAVDLRIQGDLTRPQMQGRIGLSGNTVIFRELPHEWTEVQGTLRFAGTRVYLDEVSGLLGDGPFTLSGWADQEGPFLYPRYDLNLKGHSLYYLSEDGYFRGEFDVDTRLVLRDQDQLDISGRVWVVDAKYTKDFRILEHAIRSEAKIARSRLRLVHEGYDDIHLDLKVRSRGDIWIRNNAAEAALRANLTVTGTAANPQISGNIISTEGKIHYLGLIFDLDSGAIEFHAPYAEPFVEFHGEHNIGNYLIKIALRGPMDNLQVDLHSVPGEDRKNVLCLIAYGATCDQLRTAQFGAKIGPGVFVEQISRLLERPLSQLTGLDVIRLESAVGTSDISRLYIGKRVTDRLELSLVTSVGKTTTGQSVEAAYQVTDSLLLKAHTGENTGAKISIRIRER